MGTLRTGDRGVSARLACRATRTDRTWWANLAGWADAALGATHARRALVALGAGLADDDLWRLLWACSGIDGRYGHGLLTLGLQPCVRLVESGLQRDDLGVLLVSLCSPDVELIKHGGQ